MRWRKLIIATHRDIGYFFAGLTVLYAISGVAVNHIDDWNPNYVIRVDEVDVGALPEGEAAVIGAEVLERMRIAEEPKSVVRMAPDQLKVFLDQRTLTVSLPGGTVLDEHARRRYDGIVRAYSALFVAEGRLKLARVDEDDLLYVVNVKPYLRPGFDGEVAA